MRPFLRYRLVFAIVGVLALTPACGGSNDASGPNATPAPNLTITANSLLFDRRLMTAPANADVTLRFENRDAGVPHNVAVYTKRSGGEKLFEGETFSGSDSREYRFKAPVPGDYFFRCDTHPDTMTGRFATR